MLTLGLGQLFYVLLCFINAIAVLSEDRFLARIGWTVQPEAGFGNEQSQTIKYKIVNLISAVRTLMRIPLIGINIIVIIYELLLG
ncbi:Protein transport protein yos1 [Rhizopus azygosporus]|uniref:Yos1-like protein n=3 Tax=Rhizopus TaxID=4842 RepID=A0A2G4SVI6_RHIZD|nr:Yos1-like protein [Rhizopus microsporus ATCC 52813]ORE08367.1 Yos1-like protein [Rhizopus microsporus var. microsporus]PHZ12742.1 Yos1-like protein [Rhizopus microsporus ATCC 52813]RCH94592.1 Protein transport protein yos1 [Rhizopus azygosporus]